jgi:AcrR family transcriptional regulator
MAAHRRSSHTGRDSRAGRVAGRGAPRASAGRASQAYNGVVREQVSDLQRGRIVAATFEVSAQLGSANVTVAHVVERSGVSRRTFYELFADRQECLLAAFEQAVAYASARVLPAYESAKGWREQIRAGLAALLSFIDDEPVIGRLLIVDSFGSGPATDARRGEIVEVLTRAVDKARAEVKASIKPAPLTAEGIVGGVLTVIHSRITENGKAVLSELTGPLMSMIVLPYLGPAAARKELERPAPQAARKKSAVSLLGDPFKDSGLRLTYRTVRVLTAIADLSERGVNPSNRLIADAADIKDQGQISKLLTRLQRAEMIANTGLTPGKGAPNSWVLTDNGRRVVETIQAHTQDHRRGGDGV